MGGATLQQWWVSLLERAAPRTAASHPEPAQTQSAQTQLLDRLLPASWSSSSPSPEALVIAAALVVAVAVVVLPPLAAALAAWRRWRRIPGPPAPSFLLGHAPLLASDRAPMILLAHAEAYGDLFRVRIANRRAVVVGSVDAFTALTRRGARNRLPKDASVYEPLDVGIPGRPRSILTELHESSPLWKSLRQAVAPAFSATSLRANVFPRLREALDEVRAHLVAEWARAAAEREKGVFAATGAAGAEVAGGGGAANGGGEKQQQPPRRENGADANGALAPPGTAVAQPEDEVEVEVDVEDLAKRVTADAINLLLYGEALGGVRALASRPLPAAGRCGTQAAAEEAEARASGAADRLIKDSQAVLSPEEYVALVEALLGTVRRALGNPLRRPLGPLLRFFGDADARLDDRLERGFGAMMQAKRESLERDPPPEGSLARAIMGATDPSTGEKVAAGRRLESELSLVMNAGFETTSRAIVCTLAALAEHPAAQDRLAGELARAGLARAGGGAAAADGGARSAAPPSEGAAAAAAAAAAAQTRLSRRPSAFASAAETREIDWSDLSPAALPYLHAVLRESLRMYPPAALGTGRVVESGGVAAAAGRPPSGGGSKGFAAAAAAAAAGRPPSPSPPSSSPYHPGDAQICGHSVPPGTVVLLPIFVCGRRTSVYGPDAGEFRPERWLDPAPGAAHPPPDSPAFSLGPRDCVGQSLARVELAAAVAMLVAAFRWRPAQRVVDAGGLEGSLRFRITLGTEGGMPLLFSPRR